MKIYIFLFLLLFTTLSTFAQDTLFTTPNTYRTAQNQHYWKNRRPDAAYWQQDVHYKISARIDDNEDIIYGDFYELTYWNNSPHELTEIYFNLIQNAFTSGSHYHDLFINNETPVTFGKHEAAGLGTSIDYLRVNGEEVDTILDNTILKVKLNKPLLPNDSIVVSMKFRTFYDKDGTMRRRMKIYTNPDGTKHYDGVFWYPSITVYDRKFGWCTDQHLDKEFYHDFGTFDIALTFPQEYIVEATGTLENTDQAMPAELREKIDFKNFKERPKSDTASIIIPKIPGKTKTWIWHAENVHNFAFTSDPTYRMGEVNWNGIRVIALAQEPHAFAWQPSANFTAEVIKIYSKDFGMYAWPKIIVADAKDGMEYPMLTLDNGAYPGHQYLLAHEVGHMWFYGMVGSNETYRAMMDEGFTQFIEVWSMDKIVGAVRPRYLRNKKGELREWTSRYFLPAISRYDYLYYPYMYHVSERYDEQLNTHSSDFNGGLRHNGNYGLVYYKTGTMLYNLKYVLGDSVFLKAMQHYFNKWKFAHPYPEDFRQAIIEYTQTDLNWFFDQWIETTKTIDYSIQSVKRIRSTSNYEIKFRRKGGMQMPIDFTVTTNKGTWQYYIPNTWYVKPVDSTVTVLPKWFGWGLLHPTYIATVSVPGKIESVQIDPKHEMADEDLSNNSTGGVNRQWDWDLRLPVSSDWYTERNYFRPDLWYNAYDGIQVGAHIEGNYFKKYTYFASAWFNTGVLQYNVDDNIKNNHQPFAFTFSYRKNISRYWKEMYYSGEAFWNAGIWKAQLGIDKTFRKQDQRNATYSRFTLLTKYLVNDNTYQDYLLYPMEWGKTNEKNSFVNASLITSYERKYVYTKGTGILNLQVRTPFFRSDYSFSYVQMNSVNNIASKKWDIRSRVFGQYGWGTLPLESSLYAAGANGEQLIENKYTRANAFVPTNWTGYGDMTNHFQMGGGLNLRGYAGYLMNQQITLNGQDTVVASYRGNSGLAWNVEIDFDKFIAIKQKKLIKNFHLDTYLFSDMGAISFVQQNKTFIGKFRMDAGIGSALTIKWGMFSIAPLIIRFDMPLYLNTPPSGDDYFSMKRFVIGINRCF